MTKQKYQYFQNKLKEKEGRDPPVSFLGQSFLNASKEEIVDFSSPDFLSLSSHSHIKKKMMKYVLEWGVTPSLLNPLKKYLKCYRDLENKFSQCLGQEKVLFFPSLNQVSYLILSILGGDSPLFFIDRLCQNHLLQSVSATQAKVLRFEHKDLNQLEVLLKKFSFFSSTTKMIISESLFATSGKTADIQGLVKLAKKYETLLCLDDSHAFGILGKQGMGLGAYRNGIDVILGSFGNASPSSPAFVALNPLLYHYFKTFSPQMIEAVFLSPPLIGAISGILDLIYAMQAERIDLMKKSNDLRRALHSLNYHVEGEHTPIITLLFNSEKELMQVYETLLKAHILANVLKPPYVPIGGERLQLMVTSSHQEKDFSKLIAILKGIKKEPLVSII